MTITSQLQRIQAVMADREDHIHATQTGQLIEKIHRNKTVIAMCGHFSAGKSSLINTMCGTQVLASGPIPTSANLVMIEHIEHGHSEAIVKYKNGRTEVIRTGTKTDFTNNSNESQTGFMDRIDELSKDGQEVDQIDLHLAVPLLADKLILMDTPGVDSTDDAHRLSTESALHLADVVFYVTDYNHVLSEVNFNFTKRLKDWGKPVYIIINQVDKHNESELSFEQFVADVKNAFADWGIEANGYLFISVKQPRHPRSEWNKLMELFELLKLRSEAIIQSSVILSCTHIVKEHVTAVYPERMLPELEGSTLTELKLSLDRLYLDMEHVHHQPHLIQQQFREQLTRLVNNANIMPATARDLAAVYLRSRKPGFRVGLLFSDTKTKVEIAARLQSFTDVIVDHSNKQLVWHLNHHLDTYKEMPEIKPLLLKQRLTIPDIELELTPEWIASQVNTASGFTDEYTMIFCAKLTEHIKSNYRNKATELFDSIAGVLIDDAKEIVATIQLKVDELTEQSTQLMVVEQLEDERNEYRAALLADLVNEHELERIGDQTLMYPDPDLIIVDRHNGQLNEDVRISNSSQEITGTSFSLSISSDKAEAKPNSELHDSFQYRTIMEQMAERLSQSAELIQPLQSLAGIRRALMERSKKLNSHQFTIALFGAFSAGKSSFANALMGQSILPVSPNPTTAAINRIMPVDEHWPHLSARIKMKTIDAVLADIRYSFHMLGKDEGFESIEHAVRAIQSINLQHVPNRGKAHLSFLQAIERGWNDIQLLLGTEWMADEVEYKQYVANESKSCFVERVDLHYSSTFTDQGVILVDTPGADSIHARHTGVAFDYIKNADAILFVTYYNHAFSQSDKQFLLQLGRVKDSFDLDKMFFIINAADLADSMKELDVVIEHVSEQLQQHGIRNPRIYPISSRLALEARLEQNVDALARSGMQVFEDSFATFASEELAAVALRSAQLELDKALQAVRLGIEHSRLSAEQVQQNIEQRRSLLPIIQAEIEMSIEQLHADPIHQELRELMHYVKQRCSYRFGDWYNDAFHPSALQEDGRNMNAALRAAWMQLQQSTSIEVSQEVLATSLRMENYTRNQLRSLEQRLLVMITERHHSFIADEWMLDEFITPEVSEAIEQPVLDEKIFRKHFKSAKAFFEGEGKSQLKDVLHPAIDASIHNYVEEHEQRLGSYYVGLFINEAHRLSVHLIEQLHTYTDGFTLNDNTANDLIEIETRLARIMN